MLRDLIRSELDGSPDRDPDVIARRVVMRLTSKQLREALAQALRNEVRVEMGRARMQSNETARPRSKWDKYRPLLDDGVFVDGDWKRMAECTAEDLDWLADDREQQAAELSAAADRFRGWAREMREAGARTFAELHEQMAVAA